MNIAGPLEEARFVERPNRFLTVVDIGGRQVESHLPDPGPVSYTHLTLPTKAEV